MKADLHVHTTASDGALDPRQVVERAHRNGVTVLAVADHDSVHGLAEARVVIDALQMVLVDAVELSTVLDDKDVHVLAYFVDPTSAELAAHLSTLRAARRERAEVMVERLNAGGFSISMNDVLAVSGGGAVGRSHVARALVRAGVVASVAEVFQTLIGRGRPFYVPKRSAGPAEVICRLRSWGAVPVVAHPGVTGVGEHIPAMVEAGLLGIEAYHADHTPAQTREFARMARKLGLLVTGGSDFHGIGGPNPDIGTVRVPQSAVRALLAAGGAGV